MSDQPDRPYHHGRLRSVLLDEAERTIREQGTGNLSLRDLARQAGVSHAAPRRHFADRQALLDALAETGYGRLGDAVATAIAEAGADFPARLRAAAGAYLHFAATDGALLDLMFDAKSAGNPAVAEASRPLFAAVGDLIRQGQEAGAVAPGNPERLLFLLMATLQGIAALLASGRVGKEQADDLLSDAVALFTRDAKR
jgi:AcrR family transcriptional regulator